MSERPPKFRQETNAQEESKETPEAAFETVAGAENELKQLHQMTAEQIKDPDAPVFREAKKHILDSLAASQSYDELIEKIESFMTIDGSIMIGSIVRDGSKLIEGLKAFEKGEAETPELGNRAYISKNPDDPRYKGVFFDTIRRLDAKKQVEWEQETRANPDN